MPLLPFAQFGPDRSSFDAQFCDRVENVLPKAGAWGPFPSFSPFSQPLPADPMGSFLVYVANGAYRLFVGTATKLYMFNITTLGWIDKSRAAGYNTAAGVRWSMCQYGDMLLATNGSDPPQYIDVNTVTQFADMPNAPKAFNIAAVGDFVFMSNLQTNQRMVQWSGLNQPFFWTPRQRSSDFQPFPDGGEIMGTASNPEGIVIFHAESIREGKLALETPLVFQFSQSVPNHGCLAPRSIIATGSGIYYYSDDGFYKYGNPPVSIGVERIDQWFQQNIQNSDIYDIYGGEDPNRKIVYWAFRSIENPIAGTYDRVLLYHYGIDQWSVLSPGTILTGLVDATTPGYTVDGLNALFLASDTIVNGSFATDTIWVKGAGWTIAGGVAVATTVATGTPIYQTQTLTAGTAYRITYTVSGYSSGGVYPAFSPGATVVGTTRTANGTYTDEMTAIAGNTLLAFYAAGTSTLNIDNVSIQARTATGGVDQLPFSLDSRAWSGSTPLIAAFDQQRRLGYFAGEPMEAVLQTGDNQLNEGMRSSINGFRPLVDAPSTIGRTATKDIPGSDLRWRELTPNNRTGMIPQMASGMYHRFEITIPTQRWTSVHGIYPVDPQPDGDQ